MFQLKPKLPHEIHSSSCNDEKIGVRIEVSRKRTIFFPHRGRQLATGTVKIFFDFFHYANYRRWNCQGLRSAGSYSSHFYGTTCFQSERFLKPFGLQVSFSARFFFILEGGGRNSVHSYKFPHNWWFKHYRHRMHLKCGSFYTEHRPRRDSLVSLEQHLPWVLATVWSSVGQAPKTRQGHCSTISRRGHLETDEKLY